MQWILQLLCFIHKKEIITAKIRITGVFDYVIQETCRGRPKIVHENFEYISHRTEPDNSRKYWRCAQYYKKCSARCVLRENGGITLSGSHNHLPSNHPPLRLNRDFLTNFQNAADPEYPSSS